MVDHKSIWTKFLAGVEKLSDSEKWLIAIAIPLLVIVIRAVVVFLRPPSKTQATSDKNSLHIGDNFAGDQITNNISGIDSKKLNKYIRELTTRFGKEPKKYKGSIQTTV
jgi:hypothetical protein